jgi:tetratricopeptide (TPR) repeat protein
LGEALFKLNRFQEAEELLRKAVETDPTDASAHVVLARLFYALGDRASFGASASKAIRLDPQSYLACFLYGTWLIEEQGRLQEGIEYIQKSVALSPRFVEGIKYWARILMREGRLEEAARMYEKASALDSQDRQVYYLMAIVYRKLGQQGKAEWALKEYQKKSKP